MSVVPNITAPTALPPALEGFASFLREAVESGVEFKPGETVQFSWVWFQVAGDENSLRVTAPETGRTPMEFGDDCSAALNLVLQQRYVADSFELECGWCHALQSAIVIKDLESCEQWFMNRTDAEEGTTSGWYIGAEDSDLEVNDSANLELRSLWELSCLRSEMTELFLLPQGTVVVLDETPRVLTDDGRVPLEDSYYAQKYPDSLVGP
ncbi:MAG: immunity protein Imm33 domain-containing protein [Limisphaerales bacterium]